MYPSAIASLTDPLATDTLNNPSHSAIERAQNANIEQIQTFIGTTASSTLGTILYDVRSPDSNGGGHVQTANKGGTGQTNFVKGDLLVATSSSVLSKFAVSSTAGEVLTVDPGQPTGVKWANTVANKVQIVSSVTGVSGSSVITSLFSGVIPGSVLGNNNAVRFTGAISQLSIPASTGVRFVVNYGNNQLFSFGDGTANALAANIAGTIEGTIIGNGSENSQKGIGTVTLSSANAETDNDANVNITKYMAGIYGTSSVASSANQNLIITAQMTGASNFGSVIGQFFVIEKIT